MDKGPVFTAEEEENIINKAKNLIKQSNTKEQLKTAWNFIDLFTRYCEDKQKTKEELMKLWLDKDKLLFPILP